MQLGAFLGIHSQRIVQWQRFGREKAEEAGGSDPQSQEAEQNGGCSDVLLFPFFLGT